MRKVALRRHLDLVILGDRSGGPVGLNLTGLGSLL